MKANELMIGDWVQNPLGWKAQVQSIRYVNTIKDEWEWMVKIGINNETFQNNLSLNEIDPIPLTDEILEKNRWEERKEYNPYSYYLLEGKDYSVTLSKEWDSTTKTVYWSLSIGNHATDATFSVDYVHQLQQALRLCGIEREIMI